MEKNQEPKNPLHMKVILNRSTHKIDQETSTLPHASLPMVPKEEEHSIIDITTDEDEVDDSSCLPKVGFVYGNPYFVAKVIKSQRVYVPREFIRIHGSTLGEDIKILDPRGIITKVNIHRINMTYDQTYITGWLTICKRNSIRDGDKFVCELVQGNSSTETYIKLHLNLSKILNLMKHPIPLKDYSFDQDLKPNVQAHAREPVMKKHKGSSFCLPTPTGSSEMSKEQKPYHDISSEVDLVDINGYKMKANTAPILKAIFSKYGDITNNCSWNHSVKTSLLQVLCNTVEKLRCSGIENVISNLEAIENEVLYVKNNNIYVAWLDEDLEKLRKVAACCKESSKLKEEVQQSGIELSSLTKEVEQRCSKMLKAHKRFEEARKRVIDKKLSIGEKEENIKRLELEKALLIQGLFNELP